MLDVMLPKIENVEASPDFGRYHLEPLESGFGVTLGNALRRVLLSSLPGAAVTSIKIDGVYHEFSAIPGVKEDTTELVLNVKQLRLRSVTDRPIQLRIEASGAGEVTAADIIAPPDVEVVNPELHLATIDHDDMHLTIELVIERGKGYVPAEHRDGNPIGSIPVDAIYTPIRRVNYSIEPIRVGQETNFERLVLEVWTDGTTTPDEAVAQSAQILIQHLDLLSRLIARQGPVLPDRPVNGTQIPSGMYEVPIEDLDLSVRAYNCLKRAGITRVGQVLEMNEDELLGVRNFGRKSLDELREKLESRGWLENSRLSPTSESGDGESDFETALDDDESDESFEDEVDEFEEDEDEE
ncbi:MAG TPA: DNA-directed RNA polymerase subunit alpha [Chloroflexota bacterium]|nr:DNA-directed RNA polymerase subunit alpha [Chloroflexota bacterium]